MVGSVSPAAALSLSAWSVEDLEPRPGSGPESEAARQARLWKAAEAFEAILLRRLLASMRQAELGDGLLDGSHASRMAREMYDDEIANQAAEGNREGLARVIYEELARLEHDDRGRAEEQAARPPQGLPLAPASRGAAPLPLPSGASAGVPLQPRQGIELRREAPGGLPLLRPKPEVKESGQAVENSE